MGFSSGGAILVGSLRQVESKGNIESVYSLTKESDGWVGRNEYGAALATHGQAVVFGPVDSCVLVWDRKKGNVVYGLEHEEGQSYLFACCRTRWVWALMRGLRTRRNHSGHSSELHTSAFT